VPHRIGVIADTHGLLRPEAVAVLAGSDLILHAGDVGRPEVLAALRALAPVVAVRGNVDRGAWAEVLPERETVRLDGVRLLLLHDAKALDFDPAAAGYRAVVAGHSHRPGIVEKDGVLRFNPGSAGPKRFRLPVAVGRLILMAGAIRGEIVELKLGGGRDSDRPT
jgi:putative phosphoesterase